MNTIKVDTIEEHKDGSATIAFDFDDETTRLFLKQGFKVLMKEEGIKDLVICDPIEPLSKETKTYELSDEEFQLLLHLGVIDAIKVGMKTTEDFLPSEGC